MRMYDIIDKKKHGFSLNTEEINYFISNYTNGDIPDYQASALLMAITLKGMSKQEIKDLTIAMMNSGEIMDLSSIPGIKVDKHSTGGIGDKTTLVVLPLAASIGLHVAKMSGRSLGFTGGTIDKLESIPGFKTSLSKDEFIRNVVEIGIGITSQTSTIARADKKLYALRDVTATVEDIALIASSIMSKKLASGADAIVLDVKAGNGAFIKDLKQAYNLARVMVDLGNSMNKKTVALITNMDQPLGYAIGNSIEVIEAINTLKGSGPKDLLELSLMITAKMAKLSGINMDESNIIKKLNENITNGRALEKLRQLIKYQGGNEKIIDDITLMPASKFSIDICSKTEGYVNSINAEGLGKCLFYLGGSRMEKDSKIDYAAGIMLKKKIGNYVHEGEVLATLYTNKEQYDEIIDLVSKQFNINRSNPKNSLLIYGEIE